MADGSTHAQETPRGGWKRGWLDLERYRDVHDRHMDMLFESGYIVDSSLAFAETIRQDGQIEQVVLEGVIECESPVLVAVTKWMDVRYVGGRAEVLSTWYRYHAWRRERRSRSILRYDCSHGRSHCHRFDRFGSEHHVDIALDGVPRLDAFVYEAVEISRAWDQLESRQ